MLENNGHTWISGEYVNNHTKIIIDFKCGHKPNPITPNKYKTRHSCPLCSESKGEKRVRKWLDDNKFEFEPQMDYNNLIGLGGGNLSYDFYLPKQNILIEYQGEQHERFVKGIHTSQKEFHKQKEHDKRKKEYAKLHNIELLEIWYYDFDRVEEILQNYIN